MVMARVLPFVRDGSESNSTPVLLNRHSQADIEAIGQLREISVLEGQSKGLNPNTIKGGTRPSVSLGKTSVLSMARSTASSQALLPLD
jgi:hypothetical protein